MFGRFLPREAGFFELFDQHATLVVEGAALLCQLAPDGSNIETIAERVEDAEHRADEVTHRCMAELHKTFITPLDRNDIRRLITRMDDIIDYMCGAANRLRRYDIPSIPSPVINMARSLHEAAQVVGRAAKGLRDMKNSQLVLDACVEIKRLENVCDDLHGEAIVRLFREEKNAFNVIKWREIYDKLEKAADACEGVANVLEGVVLEHA